VATTGHLPQKENEMPKYMLSIVEQEAPYAEAGEALFGEIMQMHTDFATAVAAAGAKILSGEALQPTPTASFFRGTRSADVHVIDNPLPDVKETLGGYYLIEADDDAKATELAKICPAPFGYIELRPIMEFGN
jgi:hypothetical protein